jgi:hypothetical protein
MNRFDKFVVISGRLQGEHNHSWGHEMITILSLGDTFPTGLCENKASFLRRRWQQYIDESAHTDSMAYKKWQRENPLGYYEYVQKLMKECYEAGKNPKPSLGKVVRIERINPCCKICGKPPHEYMGMHNYETVGEVKWKITLEVD